MREVQSPEIEHRLLGRLELKEKENINKSAQINFLHVILHVVLLHNYNAKCYI